MSAAARAVAPTFPLSALVPGLIAGVLAAVALGQTPPLVARDIEQERQSFTLGGHVVEQSFVPRRAGTSALEVFAQADSASWHLSLADEAGTVYATAVAPDVRAGALVRFAFPPVDVVDVPLVARLEAADGTLVSVSAWERDGYVSGAASADGVRQPGDLHFRTDYTLLPGAVAGWVAQGAAQNGLLIVLLLAQLFAPGLAVLVLAERAGVRVPREAGRRWAWALGITVALVPVVWLWAPWPWTQVTLGVALAVCVGVAGWDGLLRWRREPPRVALADVALGVVLLVAALTRVVAVRDVTLPLWVDSSRHALVTRLFVEQGHVPLTYAPWLDIPRFFYHFGFHAQAATLALLGGLTVDQALLWLGQALNCLIGLTVYGFATAITGSRRAGVVAAFCTTLIAVYPAYYVTWGRYSQLTGLVLLPVVMEVVLDGWTRVSTRAERVLSALLLAGLLLTHYRVMSFLIVWWGVAGVGGVWRAWLAGGWRAVARVLAVVGVTGVLALVVAAPWLVQVARDTLPVTNLRDLLSSPEGYNAFPDDYYVRGIERLWLGGAFIAALVGAWFAWRSTAFRARHWRALAVAGWAGAVLVVLNLDRLGGPVTWVVNNQSWAIALFLPASVLVGWSVERVLALEARMPLTGFTLAWLLLAVAGYYGTAGTWVASGIINPQTILTTADDRAALLWVAQNTPEDSVWLVNGRPWLTATWMVTDAGAWLTPLAGRRATLPPVDYGFDRAYRDRINAFNELLQKTSALDAPEFVAALDAQNVHYAFIGAREGNLTVERLLRTPGWRVLYTTGGAWVFTR